jgi:DNA-binding NarL/FixJ family response regulator
VNDLLAAIHSVHQRQTYYCSQTSVKLAKMIASRRDEGSLKKTVLELNDREKEIITLICEECTNKEISDRLYLSVRTVEGYRNKIMEKLQAKNTVGLVMSAIRLGLCKIESIPG